MNKMVFELEPDIIVSNRNKLPGDFSTPEQQIKADTEGRAWETCMTLNDSWGYQRADDDWKRDRKSTRLNSSHGYISYAVFCLKKKNVTLCTVISIVLRMTSLS